MNSLRVRIVCSFANSIDHLGVKVLKSTALAPRFRFLNAVQAARALAPATAPWLLVAFRLRRRGKRAQRALPCLGTGSGRRVVLPGFCPALEPTGCPGKGGPAGLLVSLPAYQNGSSAGAARNGVRSVHGKCLSPLRTLRFSSRPSGSRESWFYLRLSAPDNSVVRSPPRLLPRVNSREPRRGRRWQSEPRPGAVRRELRVTKTAQPSPPQPLSIFSLRHPPSARQRPGALRRCRHKGEEVHSCQQPQEHPLKRPYPSSVPV